MYVIWYYGGWKLEGVEEYGKGLVVLFEGD